MARERSQSQWDEERRYRQGGEGEQDYGRGRDQWGEGGGREGSGYDDGVGSMRGRRGQGFGMHEPGHGGSSGFRRDQDYAGYGYGYGGSSGQSRGSGGMSDQGGYGGQHDQGYGGMGYRGSMESDPGYRGGTTGGMSGQGYGGQGFGGSQGYGERQGAVGRGQQGWGGMGRQQGGQWVQQAGQSGQQGGQWGEHRGRGPKNYNRSDDRIREDICDRLCDDGHIDASEIEIQVSKGEVTLTGTVNGRDQRRLAEDCVENVSGVKHVQNNLRVKSETSMSVGTGSSGMGGSTSGWSGSTSGQKTQGS